MQKTEILAVETITHDVKRFTLKRPQGFDYKVGDATELALDKEGCRDDGHPFTMTSLPDAETLEFTIKGYPEHDGMTEELHKLNAGDALLIDQPFETFRYEGEGVFIAGGAGITPFLAILRELRRKGELAGNQLIFANKTEDDIICREELDAMAGLKVDHVLSKADTAGTYHGRVDEELLRELVSGRDKRFYLCGPPPMMDAVQETLEKMGIKADALNLSE
ncbi:FAD-binding oxidoreductase [Roseibium litorale]|uniref:Flavodoxin reductase n=1 Tax=Roseibium litorale TaxID=2803841 RepID=A0ABR9CII3_9HYPH|nr:FAD-binding oxidoreductase [Roseibium litorale]MBD8890629.1 flavodoxin reductase [Roseibium litorale]